MKSKTGATLLKLSIVSSISTSLKVVVPGITCLPSFVVPVEAQKLARKKIVRVKFAQLKEASRNSVLINFASVKSAPSNFGPLEGSPSSISPSM